MSFFTFLERSSHLVLTSNDWPKQESNNYLCNGRKQQSMLKLESELVYNKISLLSGP